MKGKGRPADERWEERAKRKREDWVEMRKNCSSQPGSKTAAAGAAITPPAAAAREVVGAQDLYMKAQEL
jgi:hypothetical protein